MILLEVEESDNAVRATDLESHWTNYFRTDEPGHKTMLKRIDEIYAIYDHDASEDYYTDSDILGRSLMAAFPVKNTMIVVR